MSFWIVQLTNSYKAHLPSSDAGDNEDEGEGDHAKGHQNAHFQYVILERGLVLPVNSRTWLRTERISHGLPLFLLPDGVSLKEYSSK